MDAEENDIQRDRPHYKIPRQSCPECWHKVDVASVETSEAPPVEGDFSICVHCATILVWGEHMKLRRPDEIEAQAAARSQTIGLLRASIIRTINMASRA